MSIQALAFGAVAVRASLRSRGPAKNPSITCKLPKRMTSVALPSKSSASGSNINKAYSTLINDTTGRRTGTKAVTQTSSKPPKNGRWCEAARTSKWATSMQNLCSVCSCFDLSLFPIPSFPPVLTWTAKSTERWGRTDTTYHYSSVLL